MFLKCTGEGTLNPSKRKVSINMRLLQVLYNITNIAYMFVQQKSGKTRMNSFQFTLRPSLIWLSIRVSSWPADILISRCSSRTTVILTGPLLLIIYTFRGLRCIQSNLLETIKQMGQQAVSASLHMWTGDSFGWITRQRKVDRCEISKAHAHCHAPFSLVIATIFTHC